ncbi:RNA polymerase sigma factor [uncultured Jatrophihabitans sp.]|uniref:RNA polymerase sigma factor n=1 Tax=uncultured Jatrophihabitans sp. TaxID=1610747 RepID=UPI0035CC790A
MTRSDPQMLAQEIRRFLTELDQLERQALELIYFSGLSQRETADVLHVAPQTLRACVARGMRHLADRFAEVLS